MSQHNRVLISSVILVRLLALYSLHLFSSTSLSCPHLANTLVCLLSCEAPGPLSTDQAVHGPDWVYHDHKYETSSTSLPSKLVRGYLSNALGSQCLIVERITGALK